MFKVEKMRIRMEIIDGPGAEQSHREIGRFEVRSFEVKTFTHLLEAYKYYHRLDVPASLYDTTKSDLLLEAKTFRIRH
jgi:hypothetical protein